MVTTIEYAPIVIFTYDRLDSLIATIESLQQNKEIDRTDLIIYSDSWKSFDNKDKVLAVRNYLVNIEGFKSIKIVKREENYGLAKNIIEGISEIIDKYGKVIVLEDDLLTSSNFLSYMNQSLMFYKNNQSIFSISGYTSKLPSLVSFEDDVYLSYRPSSWGWATWKDQWENIDWNVLDFDDFIKDKKQIKRFNRGGIDMTRMLRHCMEKKNHSWAIRWSYAMHKQEKYCIYPKMSKVQNIGFGDAATNCTGIDIYQTDLDDGKNENFKFIKDIKIDTQIAKEFRYVFSYTNKLLKRINIYVNKVLS